MTLHRSIWFLLAAVGTAAGCGFPGPAAGIDADPPVTVGFRDPTSLEDEASGMVLVPVVLSEVSTNTVSVGFTVTGGTATAGVDFVAPAGVLTFSAGVTEQTILVDIVMDDLEEMNESIVISLENPAGALLGQDDHEVTINADILPRIYFTQFMSNAAENGNTQFVVNMDMAAETDVRVDYTISGTLTGTPATPGADYMLNATGVIMIPMGMTTASLDLQEIDDQLDEENAEGIVVTLSNAVGVVIRAGEGVRTHDIEDNDAEPEVAFADPTSSQGESTPAGTISVTLSEVSGREVRVQYMVNGGSAGSGDYAIASGELVFAAGEQQKNIDVSVITDSFDEADETVNVVLTTPTNATLGSVVAHIFTILDDDAFSVVNFQTAGQTITENTQTIQVLVTLTPASGRDVQFNFAQGGGSSVTGSDYTFGTSSPVTIPTGQASAMIQVNIAEDGTAEPNEVLHIDLATGQFVTVGTTDRHSITINNEDSSNVNWGTPNDGSANEGDNGTSQVTYNVVMQYPNTNTVTVQVSFAGSEGQNPSDYTVQSGDVPVTFAPGEVTKPVRLNIVGDTQNEPGSEERITMTLNNPTNAILVSPTVRNHDINDDD